MKKLYIFFLSLSAVLQANAQSLDASFNGTGYNNIEFFKGNIEYENDSKVLPLKDGTFIVLFTMNGNVMYAHHSADGQIDKSFGKEGFSEPLPLSNALGVIQSSGKVVVAGLGFNVNQRAYDFAVARYNLDGSLDKSFGTNGFQKTDFANSDDIAYTIALAPGDKILVGGLAVYPEFENLDFALVRYNADGSPDNSFDGDGKLTTDFNGAFEEIHSLAIQPNGKFVAAGYFFDPATESYKMAIARYNANGSLDNSFDGDGRKTASLTAGENYANAVAVQADGKVVVVGTLSDASGDSSKIAILRFNANGSEDNSFSGDGNIIVDFAGRNSGDHVAIQPDGKIVAAGFKNDLSNNTRDFAVFRFNSNGTPDNSFDKDGLVISDFFGRNDVPYGLALLPDGKIFVSGDAYNPKASTIDYAVIKYNADGSTDKHFGKKGWITGYISSSEGSINAIAVQPDGKVIIGGNAFTETTFGDFAVARFNPDGSLDKSFGDNGKVLTDFFEDNDAIVSIAVQPNGKIVAFGEAYFPEDDINEFGLVCYNADGSLDKKFGRKGKQSISILPGYNNCTAMALQPDGKIVTTGYTFNDAMGSYDIIMARFTSNGELDNSFDGDGKQITDINNSDDFLSGITIAPDGKILLGGYSFTAFSPSDFALLRYNSNGSLDNSFSGDGKTIFDLGGDEFVSDFKLHSDGKFVLLGQSYDVATDKFSTAIARLNADGTPDYSFDEDGKQLIDFGGVDNFVSSLGIQADGKLVLGGYVYDITKGEYDVEIVRLNSNGSFDETFGNAGIYVNDVTQKDELNYTMLLDGNKLYIGGFSLRPTQTPFIARYLLGNTSLPVTKATKRISATINDGLIVKAYPNPSTQNFRLSLSGSADNAATIKVTDAVGRIVELKNNIKPNTSLLIGAQYRPGIYYVEVRQGDSKKMLQLIKQ